MDVLSDFKPDAVVHFAGQRFISLFNEELASFG